MNRNFWVCVAAILIISCGNAWAEDEPNALRFGLAYVMPTGDLSLPFESGGEDLGDGTMLAFDASLTLEPQDSPGFTIGYEHRFSGLFGLEAVLLRTTSDIDGRLQGTFWINDINSGELIETGPLDETEELGDLTFTPLTFGANFHLTRGSRIDLYVGLFLGFVFYGDLDIEGEKVSMENGFTRGANLGIDVPFGEGKWALNVALRYQNIDAEIDEEGFEGDPIEINPLTLQVGASYRF